MKFGENEGVDSPINVKHIPHSCQCFTANGDVQWLDHVEVGVKDNYWELSHMQCASCGKRWLRAFFEHEAFSRSGQFCRVATTNAALEKIGTDAAWSLIEQSPSKIIGGSLYNGVIRVIRYEG